MEKTEIRAVIKYFVKKNMTPSQMKEDFDNTLGESAPSYSMIKKWAALFKHGRDSVEDDPRSGRPSTSTTSENIDKIHKMVLEDRRLKVREISDTIGISTERVFHILTDELGLKKISARWVPRLLTEEQKCNRVEISRENLALFRRNTSDFLRRFITTDETWIHHYIPETKEQSKQWKHSGSPPPKKAKTCVSAGKVMASVFWDYKGIIFIDYLPKGQTVTGQYYANLLDKLAEKIREKRPGLAKKKILFHQDNAPAHKSVVAMAKLHELRFEVLNHPPYSPDLAPSDYYLFPNLKKHLAGRKFSTNEEVIAETERFFEELGESAYKKGIEALEHRWNKCIEIRGEYVEKE